MSPSAGPRFVAYYRVSTDEQGRSGLGLDAQREAVARHAAGQGGTVVAAFEEVESGRRGDRPQLALAMAECRLRRCVLLIAKLDRLARDAHFLLGLEKASVEFIAADMPTANQLTVGIMALAAEQEAHITSARTKAALAAAKARGVKLGNPRLRPGDSGTAAEARAAWSAAAARRARVVLPYLEAARRAGAVTLQQLADVLIAHGVRTPRGGDRWRPWQVRRLLDRLRDVPPSPDPPSSRPSEPGNAHAWIRPGATFIEEGEPKRITDIADGIVRGVRSMGGFWSWSLTDIMAAADAGQIQQAAHSRPQRPPAPVRRRSYRSKSSDEHLAGIRSHPLVVQSGGELPRSVLRTLQALRQGEPAEPPALRTLMLAAHAGAEAQSLGWHVAFPERGGRRSRNVDAAQDVQRLLGRFEIWIMGSGELAWVDFKRVESLVEAGLQAILHPSPSSEDRRGRPQERLHSVQDVWARLARNWHNHERGLYKLSDAIREVAEQETLHAKRVAVSWQGKDPDLVTINDGDTEDLRMWRERIASAYHHTYRSSVTAEE
jgi:DNA invertase Pin-like site-specific DNA recombinase